ncbi:MAG: hypothetical protein ABI401_08790 [Candidatus Dormibacter sp.]
MPPPAVPVDTTGLDATAVVGCARLINSAVAAPLAMLPASTARANPAASRRETRLGGLGVAGSALAGGSAGGSTVGV